MEKSSAMRWTDLNNNTTLGKDYLNYMQRTEKQGF